MKLIAVFFNSLADIDSKVLIVCFYSMRHSSASRSAHDLIMTSNKENQ